LQTVSIKTLVSSVSSKAVYLKNKSLPSSRIAHLITAAGKLVPYSTCLSKALVGQILFAANGYETSLHIGVSKNHRAEFEAHAWLLLDKKIILCHLEDIERFKELPSIPIKNLK
jgi:hypothetical protein